MCALDLISGMTEGLREGIEPLIQSSSPRLQSALLACMRDSMPDVRQSAYALVGDLAKACVGQLRPVLGEYLPLLTQQLDPAYVSVCNNASWAIGEITVKVGAEMTPYVEGVLQRLIGIMARSAEGLNRSLLENSAITIGRLGMVAPQVVAPHLGTFIAPWCVALRNIRDDVEKEHAFIGLCQMVQLNPQAAAAPRHVARTPPAAARRAPAARHTRRHVSGADGLPDPAV